MQNVSKSSNETNVDNSTTTFLVADCDELPECYVISCPFESLGSGANAARSSAVVTITVRVNADSALAVNFSQRH